jgi:16S rRNA A1518/A1519 N6-dimethyltransferase RsmA/KsgA/DIM1 with predicted DNA glycosylase/AP lyase activity
MYVKPKKHLGQHFLINPAIAHDIAHALTGHGGYDSIIEIGPGTGALTHLMKLGFPKLTSSPLPTFTNTILHSDLESWEKTF